MKEISGTVGLAHYDSGSTGPLLRRTLAEQLFEVLTERLTAAIDGGHFAVFADQHERGDAADAVFVTHRRLIARVLVRHDRPRRLLRSIIAQGLIAEADARSLLVMACSANGYLGKVGSGQVDATISWALKPLEK